MTRCHAPAWERIFEIRGKELNSNFNKFKFIVVYTDILIFTLSYN